MGKITKTSALKMVFRISEILSGEYINLAMKKTIFIPRETTDTVYKIAAIRGLEIEDIMYKFKIGDVPVLLSIYNKNNNSKKNIIFMETNIYENDNTLFLFAGDRDILDSSDDTTILCTLLCLFSDFIYSNVEYCDIIPNAGVNNRIILTFKFLLSYMTINLAFRGLDQDNIRSNMISAMIEDAVDCGFTPESYDVLDSLNKIITLYEDIVSDAAISNPFDRYTNIEMKFAEVFGNYINILPYIADYPVCKDIQYTSMVDEYDKEYISIDMNRYFDSRPDKYGNYYYTNRIDTAVNKYLVDMGILYPDEIYTTVYVGGYKETIIKILPSDANMEMDENDEIVASIEYGDDRIYYFTSVDSEFGSGILHVYIEINDNVDTDTDNVEEISVEN